MLLYLRKIISDFMYVYFTPLPYFIYKESTNNGNLAISGIGLGLIDCQKMFWISNIHGCILIYNIQNIKLYYLNIFLIFICGYLYTVSFLSFFYLMKKFKIKK
jgi:hypothetical protein